MRNFYSLPFSLGAMALALLLPQQAQAQTYYPMACRTGGAMSGGINASGIAGVPSDETHITFAFRKAARGYSGAPDALRPGECAWMDRAISASEPDSVKFKLKTHLRVSFRNTGRGALLFDGVGNPDYNDIHPIMNTMMDGDYFWFEATNANLRSNNTFNARNLRARRP